MGDFLEPVFVNKTGVTRSVIEINDFLNSQRKARQVLYFAVKKRPFENTPIVIYSRFSTQWTLQNPNFSDADEI